MEPGLQALLLCDDDKVVRVLRRVLSELEIGVEHCPDADSAVQRLTRQRFEAVIVDCTTLEIASRILKGTRSAPANKRAIAVAIIDGQSALKGAFELGAHFVLFKPISLERTKSSFRSVRALMKRERRRHARIPVELQVELVLGGGSGNMHTVSVDLAENGMAIKARNPKLPSSFQVRFTLPATNSQIECRGEVAWEGNQVQGIRFRDVPPDTSEQLKLWIGRQLMGIDAEEAPVTCKLTDLSLSACYLQTESPFPVRTRLQLMMKVGKLELQIEGIVRVMHPGSGMGIEFTQGTSSQQTRVQGFIQTLVNNTGAVPDLQVRPDTIDSSAPVLSTEHAESYHDPLLSLFQIGTDLSTDQFQAELCKQRGIEEEEEEVLTF
jgi:DNA-binding response OmpR family regulator